ncbi:hypothetical protein CFO_g4015 [Ceratocystis platani]|uniref:Uncharacterized protein n=1 Tax=Ceratocystis fimbriata f. sp. platani TaxID=88771 RepID=A0A0F8BME4_CERFI|nr:hypothetical protein CFO_g4015 [Ceratocystis platani]
MPSQRYYYSDCPAYDSPRGSPNVEYEQQQREDREIRRLARKEKARNKAEIEEYERIDCEMYEAEKSWAEKEKEKDRQDRERRRRRRAEKQKLDKVIEKEVEKKVNAILTASLPQQQPPHAASPCSPYGSSPSHVTLCRPMPALIINRKPFSMKSGLIMPPLRQCRLHRPAKMKAVGPLNAKTALLGTHAAAGIESKNT